MINVRSKGARGEREVRDILQKTMDEVGKRMNLLFVPEVQRNLMQSMVGGHDLVGVPGLAVEVKFCETLQPEKWWEQCLNQAERVKATPVLIYRRKNAKWRVRMWARLSDVGDFQAPVEISLDHFLRWFEGHLEEYWKALPPDKRLLSSGK